LKLTPHARHVLLIYVGGAANIHTKGTKETRGFTLRSKDDVHDRIEREASSLGISKNAYISMDIHKKLNDGKEKSLMRQHQNPNKILLLLLYHTTYKLYK